VEQKEKTMGIQRAKYLLETIRRLQPYNSWKLSAGHESLSNIFGEIDEHLAKEVATYADINTTNEEIVQLKAGFTRNWAQFYLEMARICAKSEHLRKVSLAKRLDKMQELLARAGAIPANIGTTDKEIAELREKVV